MSQTIQCAGCGQVIEAGSLVEGRCPTCGAAAGGVGVLPVMGAAVPVELSYATGSVSPEERRYRRTAIWCGFAAALWMLAFGLRELLNSLCGIAYDSGEFSFHHDDFTQVCFILFLAGDVLALGASFGLALAMGHVRRGEKPWVGWARGFVWVQMGVYGLGLALSGVLVAQEANIMITMFIMVAMGTPGVIFSVVSAVSLHRLRRVDAGFEALVVPMSWDRRVAGIICFGMAGLHLIHSVVAVGATGFERMEAQLIVFESVPAAIGVCYLLCGIWLLRRGYGASTFTMTLAGLEAMLAMLMVMPVFASGSLTEPSAVIYLALVLLTLAGDTVLLVFLFRGLRRRA